MRKLYNFHVATFSIFIAISLVAISEMTHNIQGSFWEIDSSKTKFSNFSENFFENTQCLRFIFLVMMDTYTRQREWVLIRSWRMFFDSANQNKSCKRVPRKNCISSAVNPYSHTPEMTWRCCYFSTCLSVHAIFQLRLCRWSFCVDVSVIAPISIPRSRRDFSRRYLLTFVESSD